VAPFQHEPAGLPADWETLIADGVGQLTRAYGTAPVDPAEGARGLAAVQRQIMAAGRFGIPASRTVRITLHADLASFPGRDLAHLVEPGGVELHIGASSADIRAVLPAVLTGPRRRIGADRMLFPEVAGS
jgi:hypothetical protein